MCCSFTSEKWCSFTNNTSGFSFFFFQNKLFFAVQWGCIWQKEKAFVCVCLSEVMKVGRQMYREIDKPRLQEHCIPRGKRIVLDNDRFLLFADTWLPITPRTKSSCNSHHGCCILGKRYHQDPRTMQDTQKLTVMGFILCFCRDNPLFSSFLFKD